MSTNPNPTHDSRPRITPAISKRSKQTPANELLVSAEESKDIGRVLLTGQSLVSSLPPQLTRPATYSALEEKHSELNRYDKDGNERPPRYLANHRSVQRRWASHELERRGFPEVDDAGALPIGDEFSVDFPKHLADFLDMMRRAGYSPNTINDAKSIMWTVRDSALELLKTSGLPEGFTDALACLVRNLGKSVLRVATEADVPDKTLAKWLKGTTPTRPSLPSVERLEDILNVSRGTLTGRLTHLVIIRRDGPLPTGSTPYRAHQKLMVEATYRLKSLPLGFQAEFDDLVRFYTDEVWLEIHNLQRNSEWRIDPDGKIPAADKVYGDLLGFGGYLTLPADGMSSWLRGRNMSPASLSLADMGDADQVLGWAEFKRLRSYSQSYNTGTTTLLSLSAALLRKDTGFLRQQPDYGARLPNPVPPQEWDDWCEKNRQKILKFVTTIKKSKNHPLSMTRDPFAGVREFIEDMEHPISVLIEMAENMKQLTPLLEKGNPVALAVHVRDICFAELITSYPLRVKNFSRMKSRLCPPDEPAAPDKLDADGMNLYRRPDGSLWIRYKSGEMKNGKAVDVPVAKSVVRTLEDYLFVHRPVLLRATKAAINKRRAKFGMAPLTAEEELAIDQSPYVFLPGPQGINVMSHEALSGYTGVAPISEKYLSVRMFTMSRRFIPNCKGFGAHAVRHLVASKYIKNHPNGWAAAAAALNDTEATVRKHYAWVRPCDKIRPWQEYHEELKRQFGGGGSPSPAVAVVA
jgi:hypothetical protein